MALEAAGFVQQGQAADFVLSGAIKHSSKLPTNTSGGLIGFGHYTGGTGIRQAVDLVRQLTMTAGNYQVDIAKDRPYGLMISMGGDDKTVTAIVVQSCVN
jgi:acetyl-CoA C-acetyltransferase/acetyl-CoA acyltransferase